MYDDFCKTVHSSEGNLPSQELGERLYTFNRSQVDWDYEPPDLPVEWLLPGEKQSRQEQLESVQARPAVPGPFIQREQTGARARMPSISLQDAKSSIVQDEVMSPPGIPAPDQAQADSSVNPEPLTTASPRR